MSSTNKTANLGLSQWEASDPFTREDINGDFRKIDGAFGERTRKKLFDVTVTEPVKILQFDLRDVNVEQFHELIIYSDFANTNRSKGLRLNGYAENHYFSAGSATQFCAKGGHNTLTLGRTVYYNHALGIGNYECLEREYAPTLETLEIFIDLEEDLSVGDRVSIWGVMA